jgi:hypothetical protein
MEKRKNKRKAVEANAAVRRRLGRPYEGSNFAYYLITGKTLSLTLPYLTITWHSWGTEFVHNEFDSIYAVYSREN